MTGTDYWNQSTQKERRDVLRNDQDCFRTRAEADAALEASGRFKREVETRIVGGGAKYPEIKSGPYSHGDPGLPDAITNEWGVEIDALEPSKIGRPQRHLLFPPVTLRRIREGALRPTMLPPNHPDPKLFAGGFDALSRSYLLPQT